MPARTSAPVAPEAAMRFKFLDVIRFLLLALNVADGFRGCCDHRRDIAKRLWDSSVFVDVEMGVNTAIRKLRQALRDSRESPAFVETISGKGYRFIAPVDAVLPECHQETIESVAVLPFTNDCADP